MAYLSLRRVSRIGLQKPVQQDVSKLGYLCQLFSTGPPKVLEVGHELRSFANAMKWLEDAFPTIHMHWPHGDEPAIVEGEGDFHQKETSKHRLTISAATLIRFNRGYFQFVIILAYWVSFLEAWNTGCYCHPPDFKEWFPSTFKRC